MLHRARGRLGRLDRAVAFRERRVQRVLLLAHGRARLVAAQLGLARLAVRVVDDALVVVAVGGQLNVPASTTKL